MSPHLHRGVVVLYDWGSSSSRSSVYSRINSSLTILALSSGENRLATTLPSISGSSNFELRSMTYSRTQILISSRNASSLGWSSMNNLMARGTVLNLPYHGLLSQRLSVRADTVAQYLIKKNPAHRPRKTQFHSYLVCPVIRGSCIVQVVSFGVELQQHSHKRLSVWITHS